jgi:hypothetical protein
MERAVPVHFEMESIAKCHGSGSICKRNFEKAKQQEKTIKGTRERRYNENQRR